MTLGEAARLARKRAGRTIRELARRSGYSKGSISQIENDHRVPLVTTAIDLADALGVSLEEYTGHERPRREREREGGRR